MGVHLVQSEGKKRSVVTANGDRVSNQTVPLLNVLTSPRSSAAQVVDSVQRSIRQIPLLPDLVVVGGFVRDERDDSRTTISELVEARPGISIEEVSDAADLPRSAVQYHAHVLSSNDQLRIAAEDGETYLYPPPPDRQTAHVASNIESDAARAVYATVADHEPVHIDEVAAKLDYEASTVAYHAANLVDRGFLSDQNERFVSRRPVQGGD